MTRRRGPISATELMAMLEADPEYQRRAAEHEATVAAASAARRLAMKPIMDDLRRAGFEFDSLWDIGSGPQGLRGGYAILMTHLMRGTYPSDVLNLLGNTLESGEVREHWDEVKHLFLNASDDEVAAGAAVALSWAARQAHVDDLIEMLGREDRGESRIFLVSALSRVGREKGVAFLETLRDHPILGKEATARLARRRKPRTTGS